MKVSLLPLYSQLNPGPGSCPLGCQNSCRVRDRAPSLNPGTICPLASHQAQTYAEIFRADIVFNTSATGDGKSLAAWLPSLLDPEFRIMGLYPTIELVEDQYRQQKDDYHKKFNLNPEERIERLYGAELARKVLQAEKSNKFHELLLAIEHAPILLSNPDIFHLIVHFQYRDPARDSYTLPGALAKYPDLWVFDEFHIFGPHQEAAALNSLLFIRRTQQSKRSRRFLFTSATPKPEFIEMLQQVGFQVAKVEGVYASEPQPNFRQILQPLELEFAMLKDSDLLIWLKEAASEIKKILEAEGQGRGLIILNSVALVGRVVRQLRELLEPNVAVREISGRIDRLERAAVQASLQQETRPVLVVGTSAVDVGVDFKIHLLIFEASDSATFIQRLGRLGRHPGFSAYKAFVLLPRRTPWILGRLEEALKNQTTCDRPSFRQIIEDTFAAPENFQEYRRQWGALQAQGMLHRISEENAEVMQRVRDRVAEDLRHVYGEQLDKKRAHWWALGQESTGQKIREELLRFRGGSDLQAAVWDGSRFYTYDLLKLLPHVRVEVIDRERFLEAAERCDRVPEEFNPHYIQIYLKLLDWSDNRFDVKLHCSRGTAELQPCKLSLIRQLGISGHPQDAEITTHLNQQQLLAFLVPVNRSPESSHWQVRQKLHLSPNFGLYRLIDLDKQAYACAFNQDALLLEALSQKGKLKQFCRQTTPSFF